MPEGVKVPLKDLGGLDSAPEGGGNLAQGATKRVPWRKL